MAVMTASTDKKREALERLADALAEDILSASEAEILAEAAEDKCNAASAAADMRGLFERTVLEAGKGRLAAARAAAAADRRQGGAVIPIDQIKARRRYQGLVAADPTLAAKLTMAARKGEGQSERDIDSAIEDLAELGALGDGEDDAK